MNKKTDQRDIIIDKIYLKLEEIERPLYWLAKKADINYNTLYGIMRQKNIKLSEKYLSSINKVLGTNY